MGRIPHKIWYIWHIEIWRWISKMDSHKFLRDTIEGSIKLANPWNIKMQFKYTICIYGIPVRFVLNSLVPYYLETLSTVLHICLVIKVICIYGGLWDFYQGVVYMFNHWSFNYTILLTMTSPQTWHRELSLKLCLMKIPPSLPTRLKPKPTPSWKCHISKLRYLIGKLFDSIPYHFTLFCNSARHCTSTVSYRSLSSESCKG